MTHREILFLLALWVEAPLLGTTPRPAAGIRSAVIRAVIHLGSASLVSAAFIFAFAKPLRHAMLAAAFLTLAQYWIIVWMERAFEARYKREPILTLAMPRLDAKWEDRRLSVAWLLLSFVSIAIVIALGHH